MDRNRLFYICSTIVLRLFYVCSTFILHLFYICSTFCSMVCSTFVLHFVLQKKNRVIKTATGNSEKFIVKLVISLQS